MSESTKSKVRDFRIDMVQEIVKFDEEKRMVHFVLRPDPRRYEERVIDGTTYLFDKIDKLMFNKDAFMRHVAESIRDKPIGFQPARIDNTAEYVSSRIPEIQLELDGKPIEIEFSDKSEEFLRALVGCQSDFVIVSLDIVGSTALSTALDEKSYAKIISVVLYELSRIVPLFHGHVLKYTGDGLIAYFPEPSFTIKHDLGIDAAIALWSMIYHGIDPLLKARKLPEIGVRIGMDSGGAPVVVMGSPATKQHSDIIGRVVNLAAKIQSRTPSAEIWLGDSVARHLYVAWREVVDSVGVPDNWRYTDSDGNPYTLHRVALERIGPEWRSRFSPQA